VTVDTMARFIVRGALILTLCAIPALAAAQENAAPAQQDKANGGRGKAARGLTPVDVLNVLDGYAIMQAQEFLKLSDSQYGEFVVRLKRLQDTRRRSLRERNQILQGIRALVGQQATATPEDASVREKLKALRDLDDRAAVDIRKAYDSLDEVMDLKQQARFRLFEETLERRRIDLLSRASQAAARREGRQ
jgi:hypothetical protein